MGVNHKWGVARMFCSRRRAQLVFRLVDLLRHEPELDTNATLAIRVPARYVEAAVGRRISRRWALNSRFCRAMKMSRLINTSGSPSHSHPRFPVSLLPPLPPFRPLYPFLLLVHSAPREKRERSCSFRSFVDCTALLASSVSSSLY